MAVSKVLFVVLCVLIVDATEIAPEEDEPRGILATEGQFKYHAIVYHVRANAPHCGGAVINEWYILSTANCVFRFRRHPEKLVVYLGTINLEQGYQSIEIAEINIPYKYDDWRRHHDISLIRVAKKIEFSNRVQPIKLPQGDFSGDTKFVTCGFGRRTYPKKLFFEAFERSTVMHYHETSFIPADECIESYNKAYNMLGRTREDIGNDTICTENVEAFSFLYGDEGNPLVQNGILYGIASWNYDNYKEFPNVYTKVATHMKWIREVFKSDNLIATGGATFNSIKFDLVFAAFVVILIANQCN